MGHAYGGVSQYFSKWVMAATPGSGGPPHATR
jgi:hypothetical protein